MVEQSLWISPGDHGRVTCRRFWTVWPRFKSRVPDQVSPSTEPNYCGSRCGRPNIVCCDHRPPPMTSRDLNRRVSSDPGLVVSMREPSRQLERRAGELQVIRWPERRILRCHRGGLRNL